MSDNAYEHGIAIGWGDKVYFVAEADWQKNEVPDELKADVMQLLKSGSILASIPQSGTGIGAACYLIDLNSIRSDE
ncbi:hypothetical protein [Azospirillum agricola]|uniref:hypothetical protein n=1 Tax=Azospirillum agricola TaxID=1720247 RepID=UPI000A0EF574|nr:hypothetical protein [Azospirillum agricola]MBP2231234.1 hypothetical protein [Azospirillum agricola]SMH62704.1 hypothetical protein SAMN02982994_6511 [Azospirillum lipoferum]